ncbi:sce7726 family protein [Oceanidesulfovibrio marinus]|nr:sce7726 family protein [Oceanidesulfovibrio marinus]
MRDADVRNAVHGNLLRPFYEDGESRILDEVVLGLDEARIDVAVINGSLHGYELKSAQDTLGRLPRQIEVYGKALDFVTLVVADNHLDQALDIIPNWWGVVRAKKTRGRLYLKKIRQPWWNPSPDPLTIARFLWKEEALSFLVRHGVKGIARKPKYILWQMIAESYPLAQISAYVRQTLKARQGWRVDP